jgi:hypothetical protein
MQCIPDATLREPARPKWYAALVVTPEIHLGEVSFSTIGLPILTAASGAAALPLTLAGLVWFNALRAASKAASPDLMQAELQHAARAVAGDEAHVKLLHLDCLLTRAVRHSRDPSTALMDAIRAYADARARSEASFIATATQLQLLQFGSVYGAVQQGMRDRLLHIGAMRVAELEQLHAEQQADAILRSDQTSVDTVRHKLSALATITRLDQVLQAWVGFPECAESIIGAARDIRDTLSALNSRSVDEVVKAAADVTSQCDHEDVLGCQEADAPARRLMEAACVPAGAGAKPSEVIKYMLSSAAASGAVKAARRALNYFCGVQATPAEQSISMDPWRRARCYNIEEEVAALHAAMTAAMGEEAAAAIVARMRKALLDRRLEASRAAVPEALLALRVLHQASWGDGEPAKLRQLPDAHIGVLSKLSRDCVPLLEWVRVLFPASTTADVYIERRLRPLLADLWSGARDQPRVAGPLHRLIEVFHVLYAVAHFRVENASPLEVAELFLVALSEAVASAPGLALQLALDEVRTGLAELDELIQGGGSVLSVNNPAAGVERALFRDGGVSVPRTSSDRMRPIEPPALTATLPRRFTWHCTLHGARRGVVGVPRRVASDAESITVRELVALALAGAAPGAADAWTAVDQTTCERLLPDEVLSQCVTVPSLTPRVDVILECGAGSAGAAAQLRRVRFCVPAAGGQAAYEHEAEFAEYVTLRALAVYARRQFNVVDAALLVGGVAAGRGWTLHTRLESLFASGIAFADAPVDDDEVVVFDVFADARALVDCAVVEADAAAVARVVAEASQVRVGADPVGTPPPPFSVQLAPGTQVGPKVLDWVFAAPLALPLGVAPLRFGLVPAAAACGDGAPLLTATAVIGNMAAASLPAPLVFAFPQLGVTVHVPRYGPNGCIRAADAADAALRSLRLSTALELAAGRSFVAEPPFPASAHPSGAQVLNIGGRAPTVITPSVSVVVSFCGQL